MLRRVNKLLVPGRDIVLRRTIVGRSIVSALKLSLTRCATQNGSSITTSHQLRYLSTESFPEKQFHLICDETLELIQDELADLESDINDADVSLSQGVLNINLGPSLGTWVINKQTPNRQIWWSSPMSGPRRYEYHPNPAEKLSLLSAWKYSKDGTTLHEVLRSEMSKATGKSLFQD